MFSPDQLFCILDYETYSEANIKKVGSYEYSKHPSTEVLCASGRIGTLKTLKKAPVKSWAPKRPWNKHRKDLRDPSWLVEAIKNPKVIIVAHNALFEQAITRNVLIKHLAKSLGIKGPFYIPEERFFCTAAQSSVHALPRSLDGVTGALKLKHQKDTVGHRLMLKWSKPRKATKNNSNTRHTDPKEFDRLVLYCEKDIYAETDVFCFLKFLIPSERNLWVFDQKINFRGIKVDRSLIKKVLKLIQEEKQNMTLQLRARTKGAVQTAGQKKVIHAWLKKQGVVLPDLKGKTIEDFIKNESLVGSGIENAKEVLKLCLQLNKTSLKKYSVFLDHTESDSRMRFSLNFNATVHGRWGGAGVQPHNFPRGSLKYKDEDGKEHDLAPFAAELINDGVTLEFLRSQFGEPTEVFVSCLRTMIVPSEEKELFVSDFNAIEARVLFWLADHKEGMKAFIEKRKMYEELAMIIFNRTSISQVLKDERFVGKQAFLGSGYGMGWVKFQKTCEDFGQNVSTAISKKAIQSYRELHAPVAKLWTKLEKAAIAAVENPSKTYVVNNKVKFYMEGRFLVCELPSGRCLYYYGPEVKYKRTPWGDTKPELHHWTVDSKTKKWTFTKTWGGVLTQNCVGGISRDLLAAAMKRHENAGYEVVLTVHDEIICERNIGEGNIEEFNRLMRTVPKWAAGCPVDVEGWSGQRYRK